MVLQVGSSIGYVEQGRLDTPPGRIVEVYNFELSEPQNTHVENNPDIATKVNRNLSLPSEVDIG